MIQQAHKTITPPDDAGYFLDCLKSAPLHETPYRHYILKNLFEPHLVDELLSIPFEAPSLVYTKGRREEHNPTRQYLSPDVIEKHDCARRVADVFLDQRVIGCLETLGNINLKGSLLRVEYTLDTGNFWLEPHTDLGVKLVTMLIYLSKDAGASQWGTDMYVDANTHYQTVPAHSNSALMFFPSDKTWHGFEPRDIQGVRKTLIMNYVTTDWINRQELVHPTKPVY